MSEINQSDDLSFASAGRVAKGPKTVAEIRAQADAMVLIHMRTGQCIHDPKRAAEYASARTSLNYKRMLRWALFATGVISVAAYAGSVILQ